MEDQNNKKPFIIPKTHTSNKGIEKVFKSQLINIYYLLKMF
jgi:hypothetical protein